MATFSKAKLSGTPADGRGVKVANTGSPGTVIHTAVAGTTDWHEIWIWATNTDTSPRKLTIEYGGVASPDDTIEVTIPAEDGLSLVIPGLILQNGLIIKAFCESTNVVILHGYVNIIDN